PLDAEREVELQRFLEALLLAVGEHAVDQLLGIRRCQVGQREALKMAMHPDLRRCVRADVQIRPLHVDGDLQELWKCGHSCYFTVSRTTSSMVVPPSFTFLRPL